MKLLIFLLFSNMIYSQYVESHQWKNRVIVIAGNAENTNEVEKQFKDFQTKEDALLERKLVVYKCLESSCTYYDWISEPKEKRLKKKFKPFEIKLYGLDGGEKFQSEKLITSKQIFDLIDSMPMRQSEIRTKNK